MVCSEWRRNTGKNFTCSQVSQLPSFRLRFTLYMYSKLQANLHAAAETEQEKISSAAVPLVEHFALVLGRKPNHSRGVGVPAVNQGAQERHRLLAQAERARQSANNAQEHAAALEGEVQRLTQANMQLRDELQSQREELASQRRSVEAHNVDMERLMDQKLEERLNSYLARIATANAASSPN
jgi:chromosome segregation ATPase